MKTYIALLKHKTHWLHLTSAVLVLSVFTSVALLQYADQQFASATALQPSAITRFHHLSKQVLGTKITSHASQAAQASQTTGAVAAVSGKTDMVIGSSTNSRSSVVTSAPPPVISPSPVPISAPPQTTLSDIASEAICPGQSSLSNVASVLACMTTYARKQHGLSAVYSNVALNAAATAKVKDMSTCHDFAHDACGRLWDYYFGVYGFSGHCSAENIANGYATPYQVFNAWMNSSLHRANILYPGYTAVGNAVLFNGGSNGNLWAMDLGGC